MVGSPSDSMRKIILVSQRASRYASTDIIRIGEFSVVPSSRRLLRNGSEVSIGGRAYDLLILLSEYRGSPVDKDTIAQNVWPSVTVDESNIRYQIGVLRKVLGADGDLIKTIPGRGYQLVDKVSTTEVAASRTANSSEFRAMALPAWLRIAPINEASSNSDTGYVAVIDDDINIRDSITGLITCAGLEAKAFASTREFLESDQPCAPGCIVLDAWLPGQGGLDFQASLLRSGIRIPIVFISGHGDVAMSVRAVKAGAFDFLTKPVRYEDLLQAISEAVLVAA